MHTPEQSTNHHPVEDIEPLEPSTPYRDAALKQLAIMNRAFDFIESSHDKTTALWQVAFALGMGCCEGRSMTEIGHMCGVTRACISKGAREFCEKNNLPPSFYMKSERAVNKYRQTRNSQLED